MRGNTYVAHGETNFLPYVGIAFRLFGHVGSQQGVETIAVSKEVHSRACVAEP